MCLTCLAIQAFFLNRQNFRGGGVLLFIENDLRENILPQVSICSADYEALAVQCGSNMYMVMYRAPSGNVDSFLSFLESIMSFSVDNKLTLVIGGDLNVYTLQRTSTSKELLLIFESNNFKNVITEPTRVTPESERLLGVLITPAHIHVECGVIDTTVSNHLSIYMLIKTGHRIEEHTPKSFVVDKITGRTLENYKRQLSTVDWKPFFDIQCANDAYSTFMSIVTKFYKENFKPKIINK